MSDDPIIPTVGQVIGRAKERLVELRPNAERQVENGTYGLVIEGWRGQLAPVRARLADEVLASRLPTSEGQALTEFARSEYDCPRNADPTRAVGEVELRRTVVHYVRGDAIATADATDEASVVALLEAIAAAANAHVASAYSHATGRGAHVQADESGALLVFSANMGALCTTANTFKQQLNWHFANRGIYGGLDAAVHRDVDAANVITTPDAAPSNAGAAFSANSVASQIALLLLVNAIKKAFNAHIALEGRPGTIRRGTVFRVAANPNAVPAVAGGEYVVLADTYCATGSQTAYPPVEASVEGPSPNLPLWATGGPTLTITAASPLFDSGATLPFRIVTLRAAGGSAGQSDEDLRGAASASWTGTYGPTPGALVAGSLRSAGVSRVVTLENFRRGGSVVYPTDPSWSWSQAWSSRVERELRDDWLGVGCRLGSGRLLNRIVRVEASVALRDAGLLVDPSSITEALRAVCRAYFNLREDFYIWRLATLRAVLSQADRRVFACSSVLVKDANGVAIEEPSQPEAGDDLMHWYFADDALDVTYVGPS
ncbi:hypothetical protein [Sorangium sp. So ce233]|uniref:hypothetical protein n=1 Tax=Sorangium sp. So ce233 TaxID=3133290 RepID=UPI003F61A2A3